MDVTLLAIESSCDETAAAVLHNGKILSNIVASQAVHEQYGGVVPELASREHLKNIYPVVHEALRVANVPKNALKAVAYTQGPGLLGSLLVGACFAKSMAMAQGIPAVGVNHMQAHILAHFIDHPHPNFPFICLTVSGGHTQLVLVKDHFSMEIIGETEDDAVGEAFDKTAKMLGIPYPGGPLVDKFAQTGNPMRFKFPEANIPGLGFSFSGLKTSILYFLKENVAKEPDFITQNLNDICASVQFTLVKTLLHKLEKAANQYGIKEIALAGGVSANSGLRITLQKRGQDLGWNVFIPSFEYCTDNAAMVAMAGYFMYIKNVGTLSKGIPMPRMPFVQNT